MKERPILFSGPMVNAILEDRKTHTRRVIKPQPDEDGLSKFRGSFYDACVQKYTCPFGQPGDRLWVKETFCSFIQNGKEGVVYHADTEDGYFSPCETLSGGYPIHCAHHPGCEGCTAQTWKPRWRPSIHMPRRASRIDLLIKDIRVERLQDISEEDARAEGCPWSDGGPFCEWGWPSRKIIEARKEFRHLWQSINTKPGKTWDDNPWVWVIEFERIKP